MMGFLLLISMILHVITIFTIILLFTKMKSFSFNHESDQGKQELEDVLQAYVLEMKEDNENFLVQLTSKLKSSDVKPDIKNVQAVKVEESVDLPLPKETEVYEQSNAAQAFNLLQQGYTANEIAKKLNKGKGEIELLLKFHR